MRPALGRVLINESWVGAGAPMSAKCQHRSQTSGFGRFRLVPEADSFGTPTTERGENFKKGRPGYCRFA